MLLGKPQVHSLMCVLPPEEVPLQGGGHPQTLCIFSKTWANHAIRQKLCWKQEIEAVFLFLIITSHSDVNEQIQGQNLA